MKFVLLVIPFLGVVLARPDLSKLGRNNNSFLNYTTNLPSNTIRTTSATTFPTTFIYPSTLIPDSKIAGGDYIGDIARNNLRGGTGEEHRLNVTQGDRTQSESTTQSTLPTVTTTIGAVYNGSALIKGSSEDDGFAGSDSAGNSKGETMKILSVDQNQVSFDTSKPSIQSDLDGHSVGTGLSNAVNEKLSASTFKNNIGVSVREIGDFGSSSILNRSIIYEPPRLESFPYSAILNYYVPNTYPFPTEM